MKTIQQLAQEYSSMFETKTRTNGEKFLCLKDRYTREVYSPINNLVREAHNDMLPDDYKYQFILESLNAIGDSTDIEEIQLEADIYNHELLKWVASHGDRQIYCNEVLENSDCHPDFMQIVSCAQYMEKDEVLQITKIYLRDILEECK